MRLRSITTAQAPCSHVLGLQTAFSLLQVDMSLPAKQARASDWLEKQAVLLPLQSRPSGQVMGDCLSQVLHSLAAGQIKNRPVNISTDVQVGRRACVADSKAAAHLLDVRSVMHIPSAPA